MFVTLQHIEVLCIYKLYICLDLYEVSHNGSSVIDIREKLNKSLAWLPCCYFTSCNKL